MVPSYLWFPPSHIFVSITFRPGSGNELRLLAFSTRALLDATIFHEITAPAKWIPIITSIIFIVTLLLTLLGLPALVNWSFLDCGSFVIFLFQQFTVPCLNSCGGYFELTYFELVYCNTSHFFPVSVLMRNECSMHTFLFSGLTLQLSILCCQPLHLLRLHALMISASQVLSFIIVSFCFQWEMWV